MIRPSAVSPTSKSYVPRAFSAPAGYQSSPGSPPKACGNIQYNRTVATSTSMSTYLQPTTTARASKENHGRPRKPPHPGLDPRRPIHCACVSFHPNFVFLSDNTWARSQDWRPSQSNRLFLDGYLVVQPGPCYHRLNYPCILKCREQIK